MHCFSPALRFHFRLRGGGAGRVHLYRALLGVFSFCMIPRQPRRFLRFTGNESDLFRNCGDWCGGARRGDLRYFFSKVHSWCLATAKLGIG